MNLQLINPFELQFPTEMEDWLEDSNCKTVRFNPFGTMLAIAGTEGRCSILDFDTRSVLRDLRGHQATVTSVSWSKNGRYLLSTGSDGQCVYWDLLPGEACHEFAVDSGAVLTGVAHPRNSHLFAVCPQAETPFLVDIRDGQLRRIPLNLVYTPASPGEYTKFAKINDCALDDQRVDLGKHAFATLNFDRSGKRLFLGTTKGLLIIYHLRKAVVETVLSITNSSIRHIRFSRRGTDLLVNSADRSIRLYIYDSGDKQRRVLKRNYRQLQRAQVKAEVDGQQSAEEVAESLRHTGPTLTFIHKYLDQVNRVQWNECCFTSDGEHVIGGSAHKAEHNIYVWDKNATNLEKMLTGPREQLLDLTWHPFRPIAVSVSVFGNIYIWGGKHREDWRNWNAFAPDFKELEQNVEYVEREDEFDLTVDDQVIQHNQVTKRKAPTAEAEADEDIDVTTIERFNPFNDSDFSDDSVGSGDEDPMETARAQSPSPFSVPDLYGDNDEREEEVMFLPIKLTPPLARTRGGDSVNDGDADRMPSGSVNSVSDRHSRDDEPFTEEDDDDEIVTVDSSTTATPLLRTAVTSRSSSVAPHAHGNGYLAPAVGYFDADGKRQAHTMEDVDAGGNKRPRV